MVRPDSGDPSTVVLQVVEALDKGYGHTVNDKGYKVLNNVRVIQGDGIDLQSIRSILFTLSLSGWSADNVNFGQGGALLQMVNRDDLKFAMKASAIRVAGEWRDVFKDPITDSGKKSKKGRVTLYRDKDGTYRSGVEDWEKSYLVEYFRDGVEFRHVKWEDILETYKNS